MTKTEKSMKKVAIVADKALNLAEKEGLTLGEVLWLAEMMRTIVTNEIRDKGMPYKREKPQA